MGCKGILAGFSKRRVPCFADNNGGSANTNSESFPPWNVHADSIPGRCSALSRGPLRVHKRCSQTLYTDMTAVGPARGIS